MRMILAILALIAYAGTAAADELTACKFSTIAPRYRPPAPELSGTLPIEDYLDTIIACNTGGPSGAGPSVPPRPTSSWLDTERKTYSNALSRSRADVLVIPFQVQGRGLDRIERALMTADLAYAIGDAGSRVVADPFLTSLALGEGARRIDAQAAGHLAEQLGARRIVTGYVGHDGNHQFTLTLQVIDKDATGSRWQHDWRSIAFTDDKTPSLVFHELLPEVLTALPLGLDAKKRVALSAARTPSAIGATPIDTVNAPTQQSSAAATLLLLAALAPPGEERTRQRLFERALISSMRTNSPGAASLFLETYALMALERRPAALSRFAKEKPTPESAALFGALRSVLDGDLPTARQSIPQVKDTYQRFLLQLELHDLELAYRRDDATGIAPPRSLFGSSLGAWQTLIDLRADDLDYWKVNGAITIKQSLDDSFPSQGLDASSVVRGRSVARGAPADTVDLDIAIGRHVREAAARLPVPECCHSGDLRAGQWDLLWLLQANGERRIDKSLFRELNLQALPERALQELNRYEPFFSGHPMIAVASAETALALAGRSPDDERRSWQARTRRDALAASWWAQGQGRLGERATRALGIPSVDSNFWVDGYGHDYPLQPSWPRWFIGLEPRSPETLSAAKEALAYSRTDIMPLTSLRAAGQLQTYEEIVSAIGTRFSGNPLRAAMANNAPAATTQASARITALKQRVARDPNSWDARFELGNTIIETGGSYSEAQKVFLSYRRFQGHQGDPIELSNDAYDAASILFFQGQPELARPLYQIASDLDVGSNASLSSTIHLQMLHGRYRAAANGLLERALRYPSAGPYREYFSLLHVIGQKKEAWAGFSQIKAQFDSPQTWLAALVGHRMEGLDERGMRSWAKRPEIRNARFNSQQFASWYAVLWSSTDRTPPADLGALVEELEGPPAAHVDEDGVTTLRPHPDDPDGFEMVEPQAPLTGEARKFEPDTPVKSERAYFADGYSAVVRGDYADAVRRFGEMMDHYPLNGAALSYLAYAASKTGGDVKQVMRINSVESLPESDFDARLARAFFASPRNVPEALKWLGLVSRTRLDTDYRPVLAEFQYAQACEWLLRDTRDDRFRTMLLDWVKVQQELRPAQGWAYAMQYTYEKDPAERVRVLAMARYLDPASPRLKDAPEAEVAKAKTWWAANNPFAEKEEQAGRIAPADLTVDNLFRGPCRIDTGWFVLGT